MSKTVLAPHTYSFLPGLPPPDVQAVAKQAQDEHVPDTRLNLRELPSLTQHRQSMVDRIADRKFFLSRIAPSVAELRRKATVALEELAELTEAAKHGEFRQEIVKKRREADNLEREWACESKAQEVAEKILSQTEKNLKAFDSGPDGARLQKLRALDNAVNGSGSKRPYRPSGQTEELLLDVAQGRAKL